MTHPLEDDECPSASVNDDLMIDSEGSLARNLNVAYAIHYAYTMVGEGHWIPLDAIEPKFLHDSFARDSPVPLPDEASSEQGSTF